MPVCLGKRERSGFSVNPKSTIISQLLQVPMATDLASGEKTSWFGWKDYTLDKHPLDAITYSLVESKIS